jgi:hypothetical protein
LAPSDVSPKTGTIIRTSSDQAMPSLTQSRLLRPRC